MRTSAQELQLLICRQKPFAVCLQETKLSPDAPFSMRGYSVFRKDLLTDTVSHGGVLLAVHHSVPARQLQLRSKLQAVAARLAFTHREVSVCSIYCPPGIALPVVELRRLISELPSPVLLLGDFNSHHSAWGCSRVCTRGRLLASFLNDEDLCLLNTGSPTHFSLPSGNTSALDLSFTSPQLVPLLTWHTAEDAMGSDHFPIWLEFQEEVILGTRPPRWNMRKADWSGFEARLEGVFADRPMQTPSVLEFTDAVTDVAREFIPMTSSVPRRIPVPWWTNECRDAIRARRRAHRAFDRRSTTANMIAFRKARAHARRIIQEAKRASWRSYVGQLNRFSPLSTVWSCIKRISGQWTAPTLPVLEVNGEQIFRPDQVANEIAHALASRCGTGVSDPQFLRIRSRCEANRIDFSTSEELTYNRPFSMAELKSAVAGLRSVSEGPDGVHNDMIRHLPSCVLEVLLAIFNRLWLEGDFPSTWREAHVVPLLKPGKSGLDPLHYRPISLTSCLCKLMEKLVNVRLLWFLESEDIFTPAQCGFRKGRSTVDHLLSLDTIVRSAFKQRRHVGAVFFDIEGAYDTTWRHGILMKAFNYGVRGPLGCFIQNFLMNRYFTVRIGNQFSDRLLQENGVPQGGVLSVALFALMINDVGRSLPQAIGHSLFVDDLAIWCVSATNHSLTRQLQMSVSRLEKWATSNGLRFSTKKTTAIHFCRRRGHCTSVPLRLYGQDIPLQSSIRFLGVELDSRLTYKPHLKMLRDKCFKALNILKCVSRTTYGGDRATLLLLYRSLIRSKLDYACVVYNGACTSNKRILDTVHNSALRIVTGAFRTSPTHSLLAEVHEMPLSMRRSLLSMRYACKLRQRPDHPTYQHVFSQRALTVFRGSGVMRSTPFCVRIRDTFEDAAINLRGVAKVTPLRVPPWELVSPSINITLSELTKSSTSPVEFRSRALEMMETYEGYTRTFTDGSKGDKGVGCAFVMGDTSRSFSLPPDATVYTSELVAIYKALCFIEVCEGARHVVFSDSLSSLLALRAFHPSHPILQDILLLLTSLNDAGKSIIFCWIPGHVGIPGNELADQAAKRAAQLECTRRLPLPAADFFPACSAYVKRKWQHVWDVTDSKLKQLKPRLTAWHSGSRKSRIEEVSLCRLRIGHTYATHRYLLCGEDRPHCPRCGAHLSVRHVLVSCPSLSNERRRFFGSSSVNFRDLLGENSRLISEVFRFLSHVRFPVIFSAISAPP